MQNFDYMTPTRLIFGKAAVDKLPEAIRPYGKRVLPAATGSEYAGFAAIFRASL